MTPALVFLIQALLIVAVPPAIWRCLRLRGLVPLVVMQIVLGIVLGPSLFGRLLPELHRQFLDPATMAPVQGIAAIAVLLFGFLTGLRLETATFQGRGRAFALVAVASLAIPMVAGMAGGVWIVARHPLELGPRVDKAEFAAAIGICMAITALPVLGQFCARPVCWSAGSANWPWALPA
jgi:Kef-type K+ transport system membrane component KefB